MASNINKALEHPGLTEATRLVQYTEVEGGIWRIPPAGTEFHSWPLIVRKDDFGGHCFPFVGQMITQAVHAMRFESGREWDCVNGWREDTEPTQRRIDKPCITTKE